MRPDSNDAHTDVHQLRDDALSVLTIVQGQTQLLQRSCSGWMASRTGAASVSTRDG